MGQNKRINNKKNKKNKKNTQTIQKTSQGHEIIHDPTTVSIVTPTQFERLDYLDILIQCILEQDYANIMEWIIVDGTQNNDHKLRSEIDQLRERYPTLPEIVFIEPEDNSSKNIGVLRNLYNEKCRGDIIVCMDDDDYYPYNRVSHVVSKLKNSFIKIGGCCNINIYSVQFKKVYLWKRFHLNQGGNASLAYTNEYAKTHFYGDVVCGEEKYFIKNYMGHECELGKEREQTMIQFDTDKSLISIAHSSTFDKAKLFAENELREHQHKFIYHSPYTLESYVKNPNIMTMYNALFQKEDTDKDDITIFYKVNGYSIDLHSNTHESEFNQVRLLANHYHEQGMNVTVYTLFNNSTTKKDGINMQDNTTKIIDNVSYRNYFTIDSRITYKKLIVINEQSLKLVYELQLSYDSLYYLHESNKLLDKSYEDKLSIDTYITRNHYSIQDCIKQANCVHIPRGVETKKIDTIIKKNDLQNIERNYYRLCYTNAYETGLLPIIQHLYPELKRLQPTIELHLYGAIREGTNPQLTQMLQRYIPQEGIVDHGICDFETIIREKHTSGFHVNFIDNSKTDSVAVKESIYCECMPIISNKDCFKELVGIHFDLHTAEVASYKKIAHSIHRILLKMEQDKQTIYDLQHKICSVDNKESIPSIHTTLTKWDSVLYKK
jgi:glycosyltransferase involved in cell wall biosynthesis